MKLNMLSLMEQRIQLIKLSKEYIDKFKVYHNEEDTLFYNKLILTPSENSKYSCVMSELITEFLIKFKEIRNGVSEINNLIFSIDDLKEISKLDIAFYIKDNFLVEDIVDLVYNLDLLDRQELKFMIDSFIDKKPGIESFDFIDYNYSINNVKNEKLNLSIIVTNNMLILDSKEEEFSSLKAKLNKYNNTGKEIDYNILLNIFLFNKDKTSLLINTARDILLDRDKLKNYRTEINKLEVELYNIFSTEELSIELFDNFITETENDELSALNNLLSFCNSILIESVSICMSTLIYELMSESVTKLDSLNFKYNYTVSMLSEVGRSRVYKDRYCYFLHIFKLLQNFVEVNNSDKDKILLFKSMASYDSNKKG